MFTSSHGASLATKVAIGGGTLAVFSGLAAGVATATTVVPIITNGDFSANASSYTSFPGYSTGANPSSPTGWIVAGDVTAGVNGPDTTVGTPLAPVSLAGVRDFGFMQDGNGTPYTSMNQTVSTTAGQAYTLTYYASGRAGDAANGATDILEVLLTDTTNSTQITTQTPAITEAAFAPFSLNFTATSTSTNVEFLNNASSAANSPTVDVTNVAMAIAAVPEPATLGLFAIGALGLLLLKRRRAA